MRVHKKIGSTDRLVEVFEKVNETIVKQHQHGQPVYRNPDYNNGEREVIDLPTSISQDLLRHPDYEFKLQSTGGSDVRVQLFFNGVHGDFLLIVEGDGRTYLAHLNEKDYLEIKQRYSNGQHSKSVNELDVPSSSIKQGVEIPIQMMDDSNFPHDQALPSPQEADTTIRTNPSQWKALFSKTWGEEGSLVFDGTWWNVVGNDGYSQWKEGGIANKSSWLDKERGQDRHTMMDGYNSLTEDVPQEFPQEVVDYLEGEYNPNTKTIPYPSVYFATYTFDVDEDLAKKIAISIIKNKVNMTEESLPNKTLKYSRDENGNWIPYGYEDTNIAIRAIELPLGSNNWKPSVVRLENDGDVNVLIHKDTWKEAKLAIFEYIN